MGSLFMIVFLLTIGASVMAAMDALRQDPQLWEQAGHSQNLRLYVLLSPIVSIVLLPAGIISTIYYFHSVKPRLARAERTLTARGHLLTSRPVAGLGRTWRELKVQQKVKAVLSFGIAVTLLAVATNDSSGDPMPLITKMLIAPIFLIPTFFGIYLVLSIAQWFLPEWLKYNKKEELVNDGFYLQRTEDRREAWEKQQTANAERRAAIRRAELRREEDRRQQGGSGR